jgi:hypothetical protein
MSPFPLRMAWRETWAVSWKRMVFEIDEECGSMGALGRAP